MSTPTIPTSQTSQTSRRTTSPTTDARLESLRARLSAHVLTHGFAAFTVEDLARTLGCSKSSLYRLADSKTDLVVAVVRWYFRDATAQVEARVPAAGEPGRVAAYLSAVAEALRPLSRRFLADVAAFPPARQMYELNTAAAAQRVRELIADGVASGELRSGLDTEFVADVVTRTMFDIVRGGLSSRTGMSDAEGYAELTSLVQHALVPRERR